MRLVTQPRATWALNKPYCGTMHATWIIDNMAEGELTGQLVVEDSKHKVVVEGDPVSIPSGGKAELVLDWVQITQRGDFTLKAVGERGTLKDHDGKKAEKHFRLFLTT